MPPPQRRFLSVWWSAERRALLTDLYPEGVRIDVILSLLNALPGAPLDVFRVNAEASSTGLKRPPGFRSIAASGPHKKKAPVVNVLSIELRNKDNPDVLWLLEEAKRIRSDRRNGWHTRLEIDVNEWLDMELRNKGNEDWIDLVAEMRHLNALPRMPTPPLKP